MLRPPEQVMRNVDRNLAALLYSSTLTSSPKVSEEDLDFWGEFFVANNLHARGVLFVTFMHDPRAMAEALVFRRARPLAEGEEFYPLIAAQAEVAARVAFESCRHVRAISEPARIARAS